MGRSVKGKGWPGRAGRAACPAAGSCMSEPVYRDPRLDLGRIYTRRGDRGETRLAGGAVVSKDHLRIEAFGTVDELNAFIGLARVSVDEAAADGEPLAALSRSLLRVQHELFNLGSILATEPDRARPRQPRIAEADVEQLEREIDRANKDLTSLPSFVLPGGCRLNAELHVCRTVCRRAERILTALSRAEEVPDAALRYLNRLSDALFVWSRWASLHLNAEEVLWRPNEAASGAGP